MRKVCIRATGSKPWAFCVLPRFEAGTSNCHSTVGMYGILSYGPIAGAVQKPGCFSTVCPSCLYSADSVLVYRTHT